MLAVLVEIDAYDPVAAAAVTLYAASVDDSACCHLNGQTWWPALSKLPTLRYDLFSGDFTGDQITAPSSSLSMQVEPWTNFGRYSFADARFRLWTGNVGDAWGSYTLRFDGRVSAQPEIKDGLANVSFAADDRWLDKALLSTYAGTTGAEGTADLKGQAKPLALGAPRYVAGKLIDSTNVVFQLSGSGAIQEVEASLERLARFGAPIGDYASYAALVAATIPAGRWGTSLAAGMVRFGAPTDGQISFLMKGDNAGTDGWARKPGQLMRRLAILSGGTGKINDTSLNALDTARPYNLSLYIDGQTTARSEVQALAASVNAVAGVSWTGQLFAAPVAIGSPSLTLAADGSALPPVAAVSQIAASVPWQRLAIGAARSWVVHALSDVALSDANAPGNWTPVLSNISRFGGTFIKTGGTSGAWDAAVSSVEKYIGASVSYRPAQNNKSVMVGINSDPLTDNNYTGLDFAWLTHNNGLCVPQVAGSTPSGASTNAYAAGDLFQVIPDGVGTVYWYQNGVLRFSQSNAGAAAAMSLDTSFLETGAAVDSLTLTARGANGLDGVSGAAGYATHVLTLYQRAASAPAVPSNDVTYTFATQGLSPSPNNGWSLTPPAANGNPLWATQATAFANTTTDTIAHTEWTSPVLYTADGLSSAPVFLYQRSATSPAAPSGALTYTFATGALTPSGNLNGWSVGATAGSNPLWVIQATASAPGSVTTDSIATGEWSTPVILAQDGSAGANGYNTAIVTLYQRSSGTPSVPSNDVTYTFAGGGLSPSPNNGWSTTIPAVNGNPLWVTQASAFSNTSTDAIAHTEWSSPVTLAQDGAAGSAGSTGSSGLNSAVVFLFQRATSAPSVPGSTLTYTFSTGVLSGTLGSWSQTIPSGTNPIYVIQATASATGTTDTITSGEWSSPLVLAQNGSNGSNGTNGADGLGSSNRVKFSKFELGTRGWAATWAGGGLGNAALSTGYSSGYNYLDADWTSSGSGKSASIGFDTGSQECYVKVTPGERIAISVVAGTAGSVSNIQMGFYWCDASKTSYLYQEMTGASLSTGGSAASSPSGSNPAFPTVYGGFFTVPSGAQWLRVEYYMNTSGSGAIKLRVSQLTICQAAASQTVLPAFTPGPNSPDGTGTDIAVPYSASGGATGSVTANSYVVSAGGTVGVEAIASAIYGGSGAGSTFTVQLQYSTNGGSSWNALGSSQSMLVDSGTTTADADVAATYTNTSGSAQQTIFRVLITRPSGTGNSWSATLWAK